MAQKIQREHIPLEPFIVDYLQFMLNSWHNNIGHKRKTSVSLHLIKSDLADHIKHPAYHRLGPEWQRRCEKALEILSEFSYPEYAGLIVAIVEERWGFKGWKARYTWSDSDPQMRSHDVTVICP